MFVVIEGSEETTSPFRNHVIVKGSSPRLTRQVSWAISPSFTVPSPNENGTISGGTGKELMIKSAKTTRG